MSIIGSLIAVINPESCSDISRAASRAAIQKAPRPGAHQVVPEAHRQFPKRLFPYRIAETLITAPNRTDENIEAAIFGVDALEETLALPRVSVIDLDRYTNTPATRDFLSSLLDDAGNPIDWRRTAADGGL